VNIRHLQLNTSVLNNPKAISNYIESNNIDIACLQEIVYPTDGQNPLINFFKKTNYHYIQGVHFYYLPKNQTVAAAIVSRWPIIDFSTWYYNSPDFHPKNIKEEDQLYKSLIDDNYPGYPGSRGLINVIKSRCVLSATIQTPSGLLRVLTTHYTVTDLCTESTQMYDISQLIHSIVTNSHPLPTIFSADLNIRPQSYSVSLISQVLNCHTKDLKDTLSDSHRAKQKDFPQGLAVDHVFSKNLKHVNTKCHQIDFSEHQALISEFDFPNEK